MIELEMTRGDQEVFLITITDAVGARVDLSDKTTWMTAKRNFEDLDADAIFDLVNGVGITYLTQSGSTLGQLHATVLPAHTEDLEDWDTMLQLEVSMLVGGVPKTVDSGTLLVKPDVRRAVV